MHSYKYEPPSSSGHFFNVRVRFCAQKRAFFRAKTRVFARKNARKRARFCARKFPRPANFFRGREFLSKMRVIFDPAALRAAVQLFLVISGL